MLSPFSSTSSFLLVLSVLLFVVVCIECADWNYEWDSEKGPFYWQDLYDDCGGDEQSPININYDATNGFITYASELEALSISSNVSGNTLLDVWNWNNDEYIYHFQATNNGHSIALVPIDSEGNELNTATNGFIATLPNIFGSSTTAEEYCLHSFHFHWGEFSSQGSEHTIYGMNYPAEIHFVHFSCNYDTLTDALAAVDDLDDKRVLAVVGFLFEVVCVFFIYILFVIFM